MKILSIDAWGNQKTVTNGMHGILSVIFIRTLSNLLILIRK